MQALHDLGMADPSRNFIVVSEGELDSDGIPVAVLAKKAAFTASLSSNSGKLSIQIILTAAYSRLSR